MPEIARFFGIVITMYDNDHMPPHFHARYAEFSAAIDILNGSLIQGDLPPRVRNLVAEWWAMRQNELLEDWQLARSEQPLKPIAPLT